MNWVQTATMILHMFLCVGIIGLVLLQRGKGADAGAGFGAGASGTVFGARGSSFLSRTTAIMATLFFATCLTLAYLGGKREAATSVVDRFAASSSSSSASSIVTPALQIPTSPAVPPVPTAANEPVSGTAPATK